MKLKPDAVDKQGLSTDKGGKENAKKGCVTVFCVLCQKKFAMPIGGAPSLLPEVKQCKICINYSPDHDTFYP